MVIHSNAQVLQILDHEHELFFQPIRCFQHRDEGAFFEFPAAPLAG